MQFFKDRTKRRQACPTGENIAARFFAQRWGALITSGIEEFERKNKTIADQKVLNEVLAETREKADPEQTDEEIKDKAFFILMNNVDSEETGHNIWIWFKHFKESNEFP